METTLGFKVAVQELKLRCHHGYVYIYIVTPKVSPVQ